ncbi:macro domain-containing protein [Micromonospora taraxaci]|uniref:macro domain-containing protein n=1 Tax=Micromonospora taraxaci TaxID=1316803 RepID=UPI0033C7A6AD
MVVGAAAIFLLSCLAAFWWGTRPSAIGIRHTLFVFAWLCAALTATLVTFSAFPATTADGTVLGVTLGGAGAFVLLVWTAALRAGNRAADRDAREVALVRKAVETAQRRAGAPVPAQPVVLDHQEIHWYQLRTNAGPGKRWIGVITGDVRRVRGVDAWVNSENTDMMMARIHESSMSAIIRYEGARRDSTGRVLEDVIAEELTAAVRDRRPVTPAVAIVTSAGELTRSHGVRFVIHSAAVEGQPGAGFRPVRELDRAVARALAAAEDPQPLGAGPLEPADSVLFPLLGSGVGGGEVEATARTLLLAAVDHLARSTGRSPERVLFLAYTDTELTACRQVLDSCPDVTRRQPATRR